MNKLELLAPARDLETGLTAINCGADAIYIGASRFGAREAAINSLETIERLTNYAHKYWARVYVTVNTLLYDEELPQAERLLHDLYGCGVDGAIIQDFGLLECHLPPIPLIASTQMHNHTPERVKFLEKVGFQRVILARELSLDQISEIRAQTGIELEFFVHGSLCVSYSGQCYMSYALGGRSGNRGQCAQPCRKRYRLVDQKGNTIDNRYWLSLKDLNLSQYLLELIEAGISAFKIEGRLKDKVYVSNIVSYYRQKIDEILKHSSLTKSSSGNPIISFNPDPYKTFNRGLTNYFLKGRTEPVGAPETPKSMGEPIGEVISVCKKSFTLESKIELRAGDGICFYDSDRELRGTMINKINGTEVFPDKLGGLFAGTLIYRNHDHQFFSILNRKAIERKINARFLFRETLTGFTLLMTDEDGNSAKADIAVPKVLAQKPDMAQKAIRDQLEKLGDTEFVCNGIEFELSSQFFLPVSVINGLRRKAVTLLRQERINHHPTQSQTFIPNNYPYPEKELSYTCNVLNQKAVTFYQRHGVIRIAPAAESGVDLQGKILMTTRYCLRYQMGICLKDRPDSATPEPLTLIDEQGNSFGIRFNCARCEMEIYLKPH